MLHDNKEAPETDIYMTGFPCQPFSLAGLGKGFNDNETRGNIVFYVLDYIRTKKPKVFILENVPGLVQREGGTHHKGIMSELSSMGFTLFGIKFWTRKRLGFPNQDVVGIVLAA